MRHFIKKQHKTKSALFFVPVIILLGGACIVTGRATWNIYQKAQQAKQNTAIVAEEYNKLKNREQEIEAKINMLDTPLGVETEIRDKLGLAKEGEEIVVIIDESDPVKKVEVDNIAKKTFWGKIKEWLWGSAIP